jgi:hypothetical protein
MELLLFFLFWFPGGISLLVIGTIVWLIACYLASTRITSSSLSPLFVYLSWPGLLLASILGQLLVALFEQREANAAIAASDRKTSALNARELDVMQRQCETEASVEIRKKVVEAQPVEIRILGFDRLYPRFSGLGDPCWWNFYHATCPHSNVDGVEMVLQERVAPCMLEYPQAASCPVSDSRYSRKALRAVGADNRSMRYALIVDDVRTGDRARKLKLSVHDLKLGEVISTAMLFKLQPLRTSRDKDSTQTVFCPLPHQVLAELLAGTFPVPSK